MPAPTLTLGGISLNPSMAWVDRHAPQGAAQSVRYTLGGGVIVQAAAVEAGREITLQSLPDQGLLQYSVVEQIMALAEQAGAVHVLDVDGTAYSVVFRNHDAPSFVAEPLIARIAPFDDDYFRCTIKLMTV